MKKIIYPACFYPEENGQFSVIFPDFNGATYGNDLADAYAMAVDYLGGIIVEMENDNENLPTASDISTMKATEQPNGFVSLVAVDIEQYRNNKSIKKTLTIPSWLDKKASEEKLNFSQVLQEALKSRLGY
ncbi:MAG: type II toxin-antitoxin system HicB family antitoxin [Clostridia bacterium]